MRLEPHPSSPAPPPRAGPLPHGEGAGKEPGDLARLEREVERLSFRLLSIQRTLGWKALERLRAVRDALLPLGTGRRRAYRLVHRALETWADAGFRAMLRRIGEDVARVRRRFATWLAVRRRGGRAIPAAFLVVSGRTADSLRYRARYQAEQLELLGFTTEVRPWGEIEPCLGGRYLSGFRYAILHRVPAGPRLLRALDDARGKGTVTLFDADDLVFDPEQAAGDRGFLAGLSADDRLMHAEDLRGCAATMRACELGTASTETLAAEMEARGLRTFVNRNTVGPDLLACSERALAARRPAEGGRVRLGYFSGTRTHNRDFLVCAGAVARVLERSPDVELAITGYLDLDERFAPFGDRVTRRPLVPWDRLPEQIASVDVNLAPLEPGVPFNVGKTELKYYEAALVEVPTVASPLPAFRFAIRNGENGFLAGTEDEWVAALARLVRDPSLRARLGKAARAHALANYRFEARLENWRAITSALRRPIERAAVAFLAEGPEVPDLARALAARGHAVTVHLEGPPLATPPSGSPGVSVRAAWTGAGPGDILVATGPRSAAAAVRTRGFLRRVALVRDPDGAAAEIGAAARRLLALAHSIDAESFERAALAGLGARA